jgi:autotransporter-associated beta strand protein
MKIIKIFSCLSLSLLLPQLASALIVGPYTPDANTLHLWHLDESAVPCVDSAPGGTNLTYIVGGTSLGNVSYSTNFNNLTNNFTNSIGFGTVTTSNAVLMVAGSGNVGTPIPFKFAGTSGAFTFEAVVHVEFNPTNNYTGATSISPAHNNPFQIMNCDADSTGARVMQFRLDPVGFAAAGRDTNFVGLEFIYGTTAFAAAPLPTNGPDAIVSNNWYHVAVTYNGQPGSTSNLLFYWTLLDPSRSSANCIYGTNMPANLPGVYSNLTIVTIGNGARNPSGGTGPVSANFLGKIDEVRISSVARSANQMMFQPATVALVQQPIGQEGVDYGGTGILTVSTASASAMGYQWWQNSTPLTGATNPAYAFTSAASANAGKYFCVITNLNGSAVTSSVASVVIGAANFLTNRYSFDSDASDSIGGQNGTLNGGYTFNGNGTLTLDGSSGYVQLPAGLINTNAGAVTIETWASFGTIVNNSMLFAFGNTNGTGGYNYIFGTPHGTVARIAITPGTYTSEQPAAAGSALDNVNNVQIVAVFAPYANYEALYTNGVLAAVNTNVTVSLASVVNNYSFIGRSLFSSDPYLAATLDEFRIYNGALSASSIRQSYLQGTTNLLSDGAVQFLTSPSDATVASGQPVTFTSLTSGHPPIVYQWYKNSLAIPGATNASYTYSPTYADNHASFQVLATNVVSAMTYSAASGAATLTVLVPETLAWLGASDDDWNLSSLNWSNAAQSLVTYAQFDSAVFDDRGAGQPTVDLQIAAQPVSLVVSNMAASYQFISSDGNGSPTGNGSLTVLGTLLKTGSGMLTIAVTNNSTGPTVIQNGTLQVGVYGTLGSLGSGPVTNNATLSFARSDNFSVVNDLHGTGTVSYDDYSGSAMPTSTNNDYTGATLINGGILYLVNSNGLGAATGGTTVASGAQLYISNNVDIGPESLTLNSSGPDGSGALRKGGAGATTYSGAVTLASDATIGVDANATLTLNNPLGITGAYGLTMNGAGTLALNAVNSFASLTLSAGIINLNTNGALGTGLVTANATGRFVIADGLNVTNAFMASAVNPGAATGLLMVNDNTNGTVTTVSGPITFSTTSTTGGHFIGPTSSGYLNVSSLITMPDSTPLIIRAGNVRFSGVGSYYTEIQARANTVSIGVNNGIATNAVMDIGGNGTAYLDLNGFNQSLVGLKNTVTPANVGWVTNSSATTGTLTLNPGTGNAYSFGGSLAGKVALVLLSGTQTLATNGAATSGGDLYTGNTTLTGGTLAIGTGVVWTNTPIISVASGATLDVSAAGLTLAPGQTLSGNGTVNGSLTNAGTIAPGAGIGTLTISGNLTLAGLTAIEVSKSTGLTNDQLAVSGAVNYGGTLSVATLAGTLKTGDSFIIVTNNSSWSGGFSAITGSPGTGTAWSFNPTNGVLSVVAGVNRTPTNITATVSGSRLILSWPADHTGWRLQAQTNALTRGLGTNWVDVTGAELVDSVTNLINPANGAVFYRMVYP